MVGPAARIKTGRCSDFQCCEPRTCENHARDHWELFEAWKNLSMTFDSNPISSTSHLTPNLGSANVFPHLSSVGGSSTSIGSSDSFINFTSNMTYSLNDTRNVTLNDTLLLYHGFVPPIRLWSCPLGSAYTSSRFCAAGNWGEHPKSSMSLTDNETQYVMITKYFLFLRVEKNYKKAKKVAFFYE